MIEYNGMKVDDIIATYNAGYHRLELIEDRHERICCVTNQTFKMNPLFYYKQIADKYGKPIKGKALLCCDASYCRPAKIAVEGELVKLKWQLETLETFYAQIQ